MMSKKIEKLLNFFFPSRCVLCDRVVRDKKSVCPDCHEKLTLLSEVRTCKKCSHPVPEGAVFCDVCLTHPHYFTACFAAAIYKKELRRSIIKFKFYKRPDLHRGLAGLILMRLAKFDLLPKFDAVIGVPLSEKRLEERGYEQAVLIAKVIAKELGVKLLKKCIKKIKDVPAQSKLSYAKRQQNLRGAFEITNYKKVKGKVILLVDDIYTTGATVDEISKILLEAGAKEVYVATVALTELGS
ncbi:MAG: ComF family protein [Clostridia bacterium]|nr:ComF family protein [Clostridia bacterium]